MAEKEFLTDEENVLILQLSYSMTNEFERLQVQHKYAFFACLATAVSIVMSGDYKLPDFIKDEGISKEDFIRGMTDMIIENGKNKLEAANTNSKH